MGKLYGAFSKALFCLDPERAHNFSLAALKSGFMPLKDAEIDPVLQSNVFNLDFPNPVGLSAGYDKNGAVLDALLGLGFGFVEAGSITPLPQEGNPRPRIFRLTEDEAVINRLGFNNKGLEVAASNFKAPRRAGVVGANLGANKDSDDRIADYVLGLKTLAPYASYVTVNISSPNTPGLRALQGKGELEELLGRLMQARSQLPDENDRRKAILLKIAPDLTAEDKKDIAEVALAMKLDGLIATNTTITRPDTLTSTQKGETGGLSGAPLKALSERVVKDMYQLTGGEIPIIGVGGIASAEDAYSRIRAGASLVQLYSAMVYHGPFLAHKIALGLAGLLKADGYKSVSEAVGVDAGS
ncbi:quinone-dependent dihydroorotate dehydrogenase [Sneathiella glossodoripedis]|uniref:quinone-dependent dihydroorotate dehydrogenase n=1 Tax=Sneathiella glossodoripedis TaxID=418853 RepID=UPI00046F0005|nr:quinone-dependent dihydroorotate dehydrogenase [Sneathiella glossodoripedis]